MKALYQDHFNVLFSLPSFFKEYDLAQVYGMLVASVQFLLGMAFGKQQGIIIFAIIVLMVSILLKRQGLAAFEPVFKEFIYLRSAQVA